LANVKSGGLKKYKSPNGLPKPFHLKWRAPPPLRAFYTPNFHILFLTEIFLENARVATLASLFRQIPSPRVSLRLILSNYAPLSILSPAPRGDLFRHYIPNPTGAKIIIIFATKNLN
jgi:hypothetical protein